MKEKFSMKKLYYSISEVSKITELEQYVLRYWETEFEQLKPAKNLAGNRIYTNKDIKLILYIKRLLRDEKYTIEGAKKLLKTYNFKEEQQEEQRVPEKKKFASPYLQREPKKSKELSLFNSESRKEEPEDAAKTEIRRDLKELRNFLTELLEDID
ncbi:MAG: MerR family transcriptional regulator [Bacteroidetes bacterium]|nr:MerR family transcriptional regulator [Bacteroidota bacterium]